MCCPRAGTRPPASRASTTQGTKVRKGRLGRYATCPLLCASGYVPSGDGLFRCELGEWSVQECVAARDYQPEVPVFRLSHRSRLDYGWRVDRVRFYAGQSEARRAVRRCALRPLRH